MAQKQQAKLWELRAATSLAQLWRDRRRPKEARDLLAPVYGWFGEGLDTPDLKRAKALLDEPLRRDAPRRIATHRRRPNDLFRRQLRGNSRLTIPLVRATCF